MGNVDLKCWVMSGVDVEMSMLNVAPNIECRCESFMSQCWISILPSFMAPT